MGGMCSFGGVVFVLGFEFWEMRWNFFVGFCCGVEDDIVVGKFIGVICVSFGFMSILFDVIRFLDFLIEFFVEEMVDEILIREDSDVVDFIYGCFLCVKFVIVFFIKSCGGYIVFCGVDWEVKFEGFVWDCEWCLVY